MAWEHGNSLVIGTDPLGNPIELSADQRSQHFWVPGLTGSGKTKFLEGMIRQDIEQWTTSRCGICVVDPEGSLYRNLMAWLTDNEIWLKRPVIPIDLTQEDWVVAFNVLRAQHNVPATPSLRTSLRPLRTAWGRATCRQPLVFNASWNRLLRR